MRRPAARILALISVLSALLWAALPAAVLGAAPAGSEASDCNCCETAMLAGGMVCPGCQSGVIAERAMQKTPAVTAAAWLSRPAPSFDGTDPAPAEPPPR